MKKGALKQVRISNGMLAGILALLAILIIGLGAGIIITNVNKNNEQVAQQGGGSSQGQVAQGNGTAPGVADIKPPILGDDEEVNGKIEEFQTQLEQANDNDELVQYYWDRIDYIWTTVGLSQYQDQVVADALASDAIQNNSQSAYQVLNVAGMYGEDELKAQYETILDERLSAEGAYDQEGMGSDMDEDE